MKNMAACRLPIFLSFENDGHNSSFSSVSVRCRRAFSFSGGLRTLASSGISLILARASVKSTTTLGRFPKAMKNPPGADFRVARRVCIRDDTNKNMVACRLPIFLSFENDEVGGLPIFLSFENDGYNSSFSSVSVRCRRAFSFSGGLRTLTSSGISLRLARASVKSTTTLGRFPKAMKNMVACRLPIFLSFENDEVGGLPILLSFENDEVGRMNDK